MLELAPDVRVGEVISPFDARRYTTHDAAAIIEGPPLAISSNAPAWSFIVSFPAAGRPSFPEGRRILGWLTRAEIALLSGDASLAYVAADSRHLTDETRLTLAAQHVDLLLADANAGAAIMVRTGNTSLGASLRVHGFRTFWIDDDEHETLRMPSRVELAPMARWKRFFGRPDGDELSLRVRHLRFQQLAAPRPMRWILGIELLIAPRDQISQAVYVSGLYEPATMIVLRQLLRPGQTFVDVGANIGLFSLAAARWVGKSGRVVSLEPSGREYARLKDHVDRNDLTQVTARRIAAGASSGRAVLRVADAVHTGLNTLEPEFMYADVGQDHTEEVDVEALDDLLHREGVSHADVVKIDVEGGEHHVLLGARRTIERDRPILFLEVAGRALEPMHAGRQTIEALLRKSGYAFAGIDADTARLMPSADLAIAAENVIAAQPDALGALLAAQA